MRQSNTSHKINANPAEMLRTIFESLDSSNAREGKLTGKKIIIPNRKKINIYITLDKDNNIHLLISPISSIPQQNLDIDLKGVQISTVQWVISDNFPELFLDISCNTGIIPGFKGPFLRLAEDIVTSLNISAESPEIIVHTIMYRWKKFWSPDSETEISQKWIYGLIGELLYLRNLVENYGPTVIGSWLGPSGKDHDFQKSNSLAVEIKTSTDIPINITCNINQLDPTLFDELYLVCYRLRSSDKGIALPYLVENIKQLLKNDDSWLDKFYEELSKAGYKIHLENVYNKTKIESDTPVVFKVDDRFPKITENSFINPPDNRITNLKYNLELTGIKGSSVKSMLEVFKKLS